MDRWKHIAINFAGCFFLVTGKQVFPHKHDYHNKVQFRTLVGWIVGCNLITNCQNNINSPLLFMDLKTAVKTVERTHFLEGSNFLPSPLVRGLQRITWHAQNDDRCCKCHAGNFTEFLLGQIHATNKKKKRKRIKEDCRRQMKIIDLQQEGNVRLKSEEKPLICLFFLSFFLGLSFFQFSHQFKMWLTFSKYLQESFL